MTDQQAWQAATDEVHAIRIFLDKPRCINCGEFSGGVCGHFGEVPSEYWHSLTDCEKWELDIPF